MKTYNDLYSKICSIDNLKLAFRRAKKGKSQMPRVKNFEKSLECKLLAIKHELETQTYEPRPLKVFVIRDPKTRLISAPHFRDRVVHHALCNVIEPIFDRTFIHDSYASRKGKGTHAALRRFDEFKREVSCNGRTVNGAKDGNMVIGYVLKCDIRHYFASVNHNVLLNIIGRRIRDEKLMWLIAKILSHYDQSGAGKGMPIGSLTSQLFANIYLNELDYFVKHELRAKFYIRYMDDLIVLHKSKETLMLWKDMIDSFLESGLKIELHPEKSNVFPLHKGIGVLGYKLFYKFSVVAKRNSRAIGSRLHAYKVMHDNHEISYEDAVRRLESWLAYAKYANSYKLRKSVASEFNRLFSSKQYSKAYISSPPL